MEGVYDSGSQINVLSDKFMKTCGLPITTEGCDRFRISGVSGGLACCVGRIPNAKIFLTDSELETVGDLVIVEDSGFDLLLGRPWITTNRVGTHEEDEGTYLTFRSNGEDYDVNISPDPSFERIIRTPRAAAVRIRPMKGYNRNVLAVIAGNQLEDPEVPDSEPERNEPRRDTRGARADTQESDEESENGSSEEPDDADEE